jgi:hypothetical protein
MRSGHVDPGAEVAIVGISHSTSGGRSLARQVFFIAKSVLRSNAQNVRFAR